MRNIRLLIEYEGTGFAGWQAQEGLPTIQGSLIEAARRLTCSDPVITGASRTDAGVHAFWQVASLKTESRIPAHGILHGMNSLLPKNIVVKEAADTHPEFDPRRDSKEKTYLYRIVNRPYPSAISRNFSWHVFKTLDTGRMREAAVHLIGEKDFSSFRAADSDAPHSIREVRSIEITEKGDGLIEIEVKGTAFLRHMVRIITGTLVDAGKGRIPPDYVKTIVEARDRKAASMTAPPQGLCLMKIEY